MNSRSGRDRFRKEYPLRSEDKGQRGRNNPPSKHLWVGNLSRNLDESSLAHHFLQFGELESIAFQPGRSYAFINFKSEDDAFAAIEELQGFSVAGSPLKIEFTKAEKSTPQRDDNYLQRRDEHKSVVRGSPFSHWDSRVRHSSPDPAHPDKSKIHDKNVEPSEVLWVGFPAQLKVDDLILRREFSPFGEIDKITTFPGRPYAFVRFKNALAACQAKEALQGKLFGNPRVHLCFAKNESGVSHKDRNSINASSSPHTRPYGHVSNRINHDQDFRDSSGDLSIRSPRFTSNPEPVEPDIVGFGRKNNAWAGGSTALGQRFLERAERGIPGNILDSPSRNRDFHLPEFSPPDFPLHHPFDDDPFDLPEDSLLFRGAKKLKTSSVPLENELPEYPFSGPGQAKHVPSRAYPGFQHDVYDKNIDFEPFSYKQIGDPPKKSAQAYEERNDHLSAPYDGLPVVTVSLPSFPERKILTPESHKSSVTKEWKWEGTIAKGGTPVCRARCFPVGHLMDMVLPEFLDCTARTSLDMLAKHYYQAAGAWAVFFVPASDPDIAFYNEFMNYLGEKQRAAVAKLDDTSTLFLVPPSDFSEKVLKVPGKLSISGVVLRSGPPGSSFGSLHHQQDKTEAYLASLHGNAPVVKPTSPSRPFSSIPTLPDFERPGVRKTSGSGSFSTGISSAPFLGPGVRNSSGNFSDSHRDNRHVDALPHHKTMMGSNWSSHDIQNLSSNIRNIGSQSNSMANFNEGYNPVPVSRIGNQTLQEKLPDLSSMPIAALQPEELIQFASTLLGQQRRPGAAVSTSSDWAHQRYVPQNQIAPEPSKTQYGQMQHFQQQQMPHLPALPQQERQPGSLVNQQPHNAEEEEGDTEQRLQATLQLASALLQQIQRGKGTDLIK